MRSISDIIEEFILEQFLFSNEINLSRNELAEFFGCAPSQINYVLSTRFTNVRGFDVESKRGGGGFIRVFKIADSDDDQQNYVYSLITNVIGDEIDEHKAMHLIDNLLSRKVLSEDEYGIVKSVITKKALGTPFKIENFLRANMLKVILMDIIKGE